MAKARRLHQEVVATLCASPLLRKRPDQTEDFIALAKEVGVDSKTLEKAFRRLERAHQRNRPHDKITMAVYLSPDMRDPFDQFVSRYGWGASGFIRSLAHEYLCGEKEPPAAFSTALGGGVKRQKRPEAKWDSLNIKMTKAIRQAMAMRARARGLTHSCLLRSLILAAMQGSWPIPSRIVQLRECHPRAENYFLPASVALGDS